MSLSFFSRLISLACSAFEKQKQIAVEKSAVCFLGYSPLFFSREYFPAKQKDSGGLMTSWAVELCLHYGKYAKPLCLSLSVPLPLLHNSFTLSLSVDQDTGRLGSDSQGFICKGESITWWQCMFSHLLKLHTGEHKHMNIKATAGGG